MQDAIDQARAHCYELRKLVGDERRIVAEFLLRLTEFNREKMYERLGHPTLWDFCTRGLGLCESTAGRRTKAVRLIDQFPGVIDHLRDGRLCVTGLLLLAEALTAENAARLFEEASRISLRKIEELVAAEKPRPAPSTRIQQFPQPKPQTEPAPALAFEGEAAPPSAPVNCAPTPVRRSEIHPTSVQEYSAKFPVSRGFVEKLELAKKIGSHVVPTRDPVAILEMALDLFIEKHGKRRGMVPVKRPRTVSAPAKAAPPAPQPATREHIPAETRRQVWERDGGRCVWKMDSGELCGSEHRLELDHIKAVAIGGLSDVDALRLLCGHHNDQHARETFGELFMQAKKGSAGGNSSCRQ